MVWRHTWHYRKTDWLWGLLVIVFVLGYSNMAAAFVGVRAFGMGGAYTAVADDGAAVFWNPAGLMQINESSINATLALPVDEADSYETCISYLERDGGYGAGALTWYYGRLNPVASPEAILYDEIHDFSYALAKAAGERVFLGGSIHYSRKRGATAKAYISEWTGDVAGMVKISDAWRAGITVLDAYRLIGDGGTTSQSPNARGTITAGFAFRPNDQITLALDGYDLPNRLHARSLRLGGEYRLPAGFALRGGLQRGIDNDWEAWTWGAGMDIDSWRMEYAYLGGDYHGIHAMGVAWRF
ncbi:MAG: hypothetical protein GX986_04385 [Firmicutes bacterium]|mgnify:CR=1 FL=1|nr:hypothetical protein [Bacillota bacterium]